DQLKNAAPSHRLSPLALLARTRLHGLRQACAPAASVGRRAFWTLALCTSVGLLLSWSSNRLLHWLAFPTHTRVHTEWARELPFPTVTICNNNPVRLYHLTKSDLYFAGHWLGLLLANRTARPLVLDLLHEERRGWFRKLSDFRLFLPPRRFEGTSLEFMDRLGHQLDDMLLGCKYRGEPCGAHNFSTVSAPLSISLSLYISRSIFLPFAFIFVFISLRLKSCQGTC
uniref:Acid sensing ion channel subunit 2 n=1 Tax=Astyanax mexicanus TaxID=7994 RepID=W5LUS4_ASTMX